MCDSEYDCPHQSDILAEITARCLYCNVPLCDDCATVVDHPLATLAPLCPYCADKWWTQDAQQSDDCGTPGLLSTLRDLASDLASD